MRVITDPVNLDHAKEGASLLLFGGRDCSVCRALQPKIETMLATEFPRLEGCYLDCQGAAAPLCAQERMFSLPVVQLWIGGRKFAELGRVFSLGELRAAITRPYRAAFD